MSVVVDHDKHITTIATIATPFHNLFERMIPATSVL